MKTMAWILVSLALVIPAPAFAAADLSPLRVATDVQKWIPELPGTGPLRRLIADYQDILRPGDYYDVSTVEDENVGLEAYIESLLDQDSRLTAQAQSFYAAIAELDARRAPFGNTAMLPLGLQATLAHVAGDVFNPDLRPGWAWDTALRAAEGDPDRAMRIIGVCGHDDILRNGVSVGNWTLKCPPQDSVFYLPQSLGRSADIPQRLKDRIVELQEDYNSEVGIPAFRPRGATIAAKYYHVYGSAFVACEMIRRGHDRELVVLLARLLAYAYRSEAARDWAQDLSGLHDESEANPDFTEMQRLNFEQSYETRDAFELMRSWTLSGSLKLGSAKIDIPYTTIRIAFPGFLEDTELDRWLHPRPAGWSDARFERAKKRLRGMLIDWKWTMAEHEAGARFAAAVCGRAK